MEKKTKKWLTVTNIMALLMVVLYILDRWVIPISDSYNGFKWEELWNESVIAIYGENYFNNLSDMEKETLEISRIIGGNCGGVITNSLGIISKDINPNGEAFYRYFTVVFTHAFHLHLITNVLAFLIIGNYIEEKLGSISMIGLFFITDILGVPLTNLITGFDSIDAKVTAGASAGVFGLFGIGFVMCLLNKNNFKDFPKLNKIYLIIYGVVPTYIISFGWTTIAHNISFIIGIALGYILNFIFPKFKDIVKKDKIKEKITTTIDLK